MPTMRRMEPHGSDMKARQTPIVTRREALSLLGIRKSSLFDLEREARIPRCRDREGYTPGELRRLFNAVRKVLGQRGAAES